MRTTCARPFDTAEISLGGEVFPCSPHRLLMPLGNVLTSDWETIWNGPAARDYRRSAIDGSYRFCLSCRCALLADGLDEERPAEGAEDARATDIVVNAAPVRLVLSYDPSCDLACPACRSEVFVQRDPERTAELERITDWVIDAIDRRLGIESVVIAAQGEPFASPHYCRILQHLARRDCGPLKLEIQTHGAALTDEVWAAIAGIARYPVAVDVSLDAAWPWSYPQVRRQGQWAAVAANLKFLEQLRRSGRIARLSISMVVQAENYWQMPEFVALGKARGCDEVTFTRLRNIALHLAPSFAPRNVCDERHPEHSALREILRHPLLDDPICRLDELSRLRDTAKRAARIDQPLIQRRGGLPPADDYVSEIARAVDSGRHDGALALAAAGLGFHADSAPLWMAAAKAASAMGAHSRAADLLYRARYLPGGERVMYLLCVALGESGRHAEQAALVNL